MRGPLAIAFVLWSGAVGGAQRHTVALASTIEQAGLARAHVAFVDRGQPVLGRLASEGYPVAATELALGRGRHVLLHPRLLAKALDHVGADVVFGPVAGLTALAVRAGGYAGTLIGVEHGAMLNRDALPPVKRLVHTGSLVAVRPLFDAFVAVSDMMAEEVHRTLGTRVAVYTVPNGVDTTRFTPRAQRRHRDIFRLGVAARLVAGKGVREAILAMKPEDAGEIELCIAGDGPQRAELERLARDRDLAACVRFLGEVADMRAFWQSCDVAVHAANGLRESFCLSVAEAQACGLPAIVSNAGALPSVVTHGVTGIVVRPGDIPELRAALTRYAADRTLRKRHGAAARERACREFSLHRVAGDYVAVACEVASRRRLTQRL